MVTRRLLALALLFSALGGFFYGCVKPPWPPPSTLKINQVETGPLRGKTIVLDPGHGGPEHGALGPHGLQEAEVNLGVSLYLWGMLQYAGANALLTRSADTSVDHGAVFSLEKDLDARSAMANQSNADLFISIHHNSDINRRNRNDVQIYYKMADTGPSRDVAKSILQSLKQKLNVADGNIYPGNYRVLRTTAAAAILGESSFISNKNNEGKLSYQRTLQREAEGYFEGILSYYQKGVPLIADLYPHNITLADTRPEIRALIISGVGNTAIDSSSIRAKIDGKAYSSLALHPDGTISFITQEHLGNGQHTLCINVKNMAGNSAPEKCASFITSAPPSSVALKPVFPVIPPDGISSTAIDVSVFDYLQRPVIDGTRVTLTTTGGRFLEPSATTIDGHARAILISGKKGRTVTITATAGSIHTKTSVAFAVPEEALFLATIMDSSGNPISGAEFVSNGKQVAVSDGRGLAFNCNASSGSVVYTICKKGFQPITRKTILVKGKMMRENIILNQIDGGILLNKRIMLDPAGFTNLSLPVITELREKIEYAGGSVFLTWENAPAPALKERILAAAKEKADLFISIEITRRELSAGYYHKSRLGRVLAENTCREFDSHTEGKWKKCTPLISDHFLIIQTAMPAVLIRLPQSSLKNTSAVVSNIYQALLNTLNKI